MNFEVRDISLVGGWCTYLIDIFGVYQEWSGTRKSICTKIKDQVLKVNKKKESAVVYIVAVNICTTL